MNSPRNFPPKIYTILKRLFAITMRPPPKQSVQIWPTFPRDFPKRLLEFLPAPYATHLGNICVRISPTVTTISSLKSEHLCHIISRTFFENSLFEALVPPTGFHLKFPRLTQNTCVIASPARFLKKSSKHLVLCISTLYTLPV